MRFEKHLFVCVNERPPENPVGCCKAKGSEKIVDMLKTAVQQHKLGGKIRINKSGCLSQCSKGVTIVVYPEGVWYGRVTPADVPEIVESHLLKGIPVERLKI